jgi:plastocyanin domain-containing protein
LGIALAWAAALAQTPTGGKAVAPAPKVVELEVTKDGFVPRQVRVKAGQPVTLRVTRTVERTCATDIVIKDFNISRALPLRAPVEVTLTPTKPGTVRYSCAMGMVDGELVVE